MSMPITRLHWMSHVTLRKPTKLRKEIAMMQPTPKESHVPTDELVDIREVSGLKSHQAQAKILCRVLDIRVTDLMEMQAGFENLELICDRGILEVSSRGEIVNFILDFPELREKQCVGFRPGSGVIRIECHYL